MKDRCPFSECARCAFLFYRPDSGASAVQPFYDESHWETERKEALRREADDAFLRALELLCLSSLRVENVLDFGCGLGVTVQMLRDKLGLNAVGVDLSADFVETAYLHRCGLTEFSSKYPPGYFDAIYSVEVFEHLQEPKEIVTALRRLLKPEGKILINTGTREYLSRYDPDLNYIDPLRRGHISIYSLQSFQQLASAAGLIAEFVGARKYEILLSATHDPANTHPDNFERMRCLGEWYPALFREYMRLIYVEREFEERSVWALQLAEKVDQLSHETWRGSQSGQWLTKFWKRLARH
jgi:SAM-dependent methyltransferase